MKCHSSAKKKDIRGSSGPRLYKPLDTSKNAKRRRVVTQAHIYDESAESDGYLSVLHNLLNLWLQTAKILASLAFYIIRWWCCKEGRDAAEKKGVDHVQRKFPTPLENEFAIYRRLGYRRLEESVNTTWFSKASFLSLHSRKVLDHIYQEVVRYFWQMFKDFNSPVIQVCLVVIDLPFFTKAHH